MQEKEKRRERESERNEKRGKREQATKDDPKWNIQLNHNVIGENENGFSLQTMSSLLLSICVLAHFTTSSP